MSSKTAFSELPIAAESNFPISSLVPKVETGVLNFLQKHPEYDGRDVTIAILDSGVDPRAIGLETLCDGKSVKVIERFDCTGCGDVDTTKKVTADENNCIIGLSGRELKLTKEMIESNTAKGEFRLGLKSFDDLIPSKTRDNMKNARKRIEWDCQNKMAIADVTRKLNNFESQNSDTSKLSWDKKLVKDNLDYTLEVLTCYDKTYNDIKTTYDCLLYPTEKGWQACVDVEENGDLKEALFINEYSKTQEVKNINDYLSISINVHDDGDVLEIVGMCSPHGTHVASIASGNHELKDYNGVAPNAKIVSLTIGDGRLGSMETGTALVRAMLKIMELCRTGRKVDVINMSYGEHSHWSNSGRIGELMSEIVNKYGVVWVASAGNHGPALCTVGTPPDISQPVIIGVGAYVSPQVMEAEYAMREKLPGNVYTWTSRDPCIDGGQGVTVCAPGSAITSVPQFTMTKSQLMNGTSMAAPHVAGAVALLISGLKQMNIDYSPYSIKRALAVTATKLSYVDEFAQGNGLLNVEKAFEHLCEYRAAKENLLRFSVRCGINNSKGVHLRKMFLDKTFEVGVTIEPVFLNDKEVAPEEKFNFNVRLNLVPSQPFVQVGAFLDLSYSSRTINVKIDPVGLTAGVHTAVIQAYDTDCIQKGALFQIPITIVQPHVVQPQDMFKFTSTSVRNDGSTEFQPNTIVRNFILVPKGASWAVFRIRSTDQHADKDHGKFFIHTMQLIPKMSCRVLETMKIFSVRPEIDTVLPFRVRENNILEVCLAKYWSNYGLSHVRYSIEFHGIQFNNIGATSMHAGRGIHKLAIQALNIEELQPAIILKNALVVLKPTDSKISPLSSTRDVVPDGRQIYQNLLTYTLNVNKANEIILHAPLFNSVLYESEFESQLWMIFDSNKVMVACGDAHSEKFSTKLEKGEYTIKLQIRHEKRELLEKISEATFLAYYKLSNQINIDLYETYNQAVTSGKKFNNCLLRENCPKIIYAAPLSQEKLTKANLPTNCAGLIGTIILPKEECGRRVETREFTYYLSPMDNGKKNGNGGNSATNLSASTSKISITASSTTVAPVAVPSTSGDGNTSLVSAIAANANNANNQSSPKKGKSNDDYVESLRDFQSGMISKCELELAEKIYEEVIAAHPKHLVAHLNLIQNIESQNTDSKNGYPFSFVKLLKENGDGNGKNDEDPKEIQQKQRTSLERIIKLADLIINETDKDSLLAFYGLKNDTRPDASKIKANIDKQKVTLLESLARKGIALIKLGILDDNTKDRLDDIDNIFTDIMKFSDMTDSKVILFSLWHAYAHQHYGRMSKYLQKMFDDKRQRENIEEFGLIANAMDYPHLQTAIERLTVSYYPDSYRIF